VSKKSYIVVVHNWHVYSDGFVVHHFQAENDEEWLRRVGKETDES
jgi:hypothetical protein